MPPQLPPESHYDPNKIQKIFAIAAVVLLLSILGLFAKDYSRQWKDYQRQFKAMEVEKTRVKIDAEENELSKNSDYQNVLKELAEAKKKVDLQNGRLQQIQQQVHAAEIVQKLHTQQSQFAKAQYGALK